MARYADTLRDDLTEAPIKGALVSVIVNSTGEAATLTNDDTTSLANPFKTDKFGSVVFNAADDFYDLEYRYGGRLVRKDFKYPLGDVLDQYRGPPGSPGANVMAVGAFTDLSVMTIPTGTDVIQTSCYTPPTPPFANVGRALYVYDATITPTEVSTYPNCVAISANGRGFRLPLDGTMIPFEAFGANPNDSTDCYPAFQAMKAYALAHLTGGSLPIDFDTAWPFPVYFSGKYYSSHYWSVHGAVTWRGFQTTGTGGAHITYVRFPADSWGVIFNNERSDADQVGSAGSQHNSFGSLVENMTFYSTGGTNRAKHGVWARTQITLRDVTIGGFSGNGLNIVGSSAATTTGTNTLYGNANYGYYERVALYDNGGHAAFLDGTDGNANTFVGCRTDFSGWAAFYDSSFLGNHFYGCDINSCGSNDAGGVTYLGNHYTFISETAADGATTPGTNSAIWALEGSGSVTARYPTWDVAGSYVISCPYYVTGVNARSLVSNPYIEGGLYLSHVAVPSVVLYPDAISSFSQSSNIIISNNGSGGINTSPLGFGSARTPASLGGSHVTAIGGDDSTVFSSAVPGVGTFNLARVSTTRLSSNWGGAGASFTFNFDGPGTTITCGTAITQPYTTWASKFAIGPTSTSLRFIGLIGVFGGGLADLNNTPVAQGAFYLNRDPTAGGIGAYFITTGGAIATATWAGSTAYALNALVTNDSGKSYICTTAGTSASSGGPTGTGTNITDGTAHWNYIAPFVATPIQAGVLGSVSSTPSFVGQFAVVAGVGYMATGVSSSADWKQITN